MQGHLTSLTLAGVFRHLGENRASGTLHVSNGNLSGAVRFSSGSVAGASGQGGSLAELFSWSSGEYRFEDGPASPSGPGSERVAPLRAILEGTRAVAEPESLRDVLGGPQARLRRSDKVAAELESSLLTPVELSVLERCSVSAPESTLAELLSGSELPSEETLRCVHTLVAAGALELEAPESVHEKTSELSVAAPESRASSPALAPGEIPVQIGRYSVEGVLGRGAMGLVVAARDPEIDRTVAIKVIQSAVHLDEAQLASYEARFRQEAKAAGKLLHPGIVAVFDAGRSETGAPYLVMEHVEGETLKERFDRRPATPEECREIADQILDALQLAHDSGIVHRDLKPQNVIITREGRAKVMDFGVAHVVGSELTQDDEMLGSPAYMAPEQLSNVPVDGRTDLFALGVVLHWMLTSKMPFEGDSLAAIVTAILTKTPAPPRQLRSTVPADLNAIVLRCLAKDPDARFGSAREMREALAGRDGGTGLPAWARRLRWPAWAAAALALTALAFFAGRGGGDPEGSVATSDPTAGTAGSLERPPPLSPTQRLFANAQAAFEAGHVQRSHELLESLLERDPRFGGATELLLEVKAEALRRTLPIELAAKHDHRMGSCEGRLTLAEGRIEFASDDHGAWRWAFDQIVHIERRDDRHLELRTEERDTLKLGGSKSYKFELDEPLAQETWSAFRTISNR